MDCKEMLHCVWDMSVGEYGGWRVMPEEEVKSRGSELAKAAQRTGYDEIAAVHADMLSVEKGHVSRRDVTPGWWSCRSVSGSDRFIVLIRQYDDGNGVFAEEVAAEGGCPVCHLTDFKKVSEE
jgi:hypothetical protein